MTKTVAGNTTQYFYDEQGHLTGEYDGAGQLIQEIIWLGDLPVAVLRTSAPAATPDLYYIHADHLGTPRKITRPNDNRVVWSWESEAFGNSLPDQNPSGLGEFVFNLRFPGQYYDAETGLHYNMARSYNPKTGRYDENDPIGLAGGINTYGYAGDNPLRYIDPLGLTQYDINVARELAIETQADLSFPDGYKIMDLGKTEDGGEIHGNTIPGVGTQLDDRYLKPLTDSEAAELLDTVVHEAVHFSLDRHDPRQADGKRSGYPYDQAKKRTTKELVRKYNRTRKLPDCDKMCCK